MSWIKVMSGSFFVVALASVATAQTKVSGIAQCMKPDKQESIAVGDRPDHMYMIAQYKCKWTTPLEVEGIKSKEGLSTEFGDVSGDKVNSRGFYLDTMENGDKAYVRYQGNATMKDGAPQTAEGTWTYNGGTGKMKGIKGKGKYSGKGNADGSVTFTVEGEYSMPAPKPAKGK
jgi:hypothetical protein